MDRLPEMLEGSHSEIVVGSSGLGTRCPLFCTVFKNLPESHESVLHNQPMSLILPPCESRSVKRETKVRPQASGRNEMPRTTEQWVQLLKSRCQSEGIECSLSDSELWSWVKAGVNASDSEDSVFAALCETLTQEEVTHPGQEV
jgi:hypothetical protein